MHSSSSTDRYVWLTCLQFASVLVALSGPCLGAFGCLSSYGASLAGDTAAALVSTLIIEPEGGQARIKSLLQGATKSIDMTMYELVDSDIEQILVDRAAQKVVVRVLLDRNREATHNQAAFDFLAAHGVQVKWALPQYPATHQKTITVDGTTTLIMTCNLASIFYATTRDFAVIDTDMADNAAIEQVFAADFGGQTITPPFTPALIWSPTQSQNAIVSFIGTAQHSLAIENEEMSDAIVIDALIEAAKRGVNIDITMTLLKDWVDNFDKLTAAGVHIAVYEPTASLYIHAKVILLDAATDNQKLFLGSQNLSFDSLNKNRELGMTLTAPAILSAVGATLAKDFQGGRAWQLSVPKK
jgi:phosphatidylserine/phosphatidylglycerophosphate/cardiolipin synthase-like enzyme